MFDGPDVRLNQSPFQNADGAQRSRNFRLPRTLVIPGWARGATTGGTEASRRAFVGTLSGGGQSTLSITFLDGLVLTTQVEIAGIPKASPVTGTEFDWQLTVSAVDPYLYGVAQTYSTALPSASGGLDWATGGGLDWSTGGGLNWGTVGSTGLMTLVNSGFEESWPTFTINAPTDGATLVNPIAVDTGRGNQLAYTDTLILGDVVVINTSPLNRFRAEERRALPGEPDDGPVLQRSRAVLGDSPVPGHLVQHHGRTERLTALRVLGLFSFPAWLIRAPSCVQTGVRDAARQLHDCLA